MTLIRHVLTLAKTAAFNCTIFVRSDKLSGTMTPDTSRKCLLQPHR